MKAINKLRKRRAISPVIATVILVAVAISVAVAVSYWMSGIAGQYTAFEQVEIQTGVCTIDGFGNWVIGISLKNTGTASATLTNVFVNDVEVSGGYTTDVPPVHISGYAATTPAAGLIKTNLDPTASTATITSGATAQITVYVGAVYGTLSSGTTVNIKIHSAGGMDYIKLIKLV